MTDKQSVVVATRLVLDPKAIIDRLEKEFSIELAIGEKNVPKNLQGKLDNVAALVTTSHDGVPDWIWDSGNLKIIGNFGVGYDGINVQQVAEKGVWVTNTPDVLSDGVAETAIGMILTLLRKFGKAEANARSGKWAKGEIFPLSHELCGKNLGMLGMGRVGREIALRAESFKVGIAYTSRQEKNVPWRYEPSLLELARWSDILCSVLPGTPSTDNLVDEDVLAALGPEGYLVNIGRGNVLDEKTLAAFIKKGGLKGAALDVYANEPNIEPDLLDLENVLLLPHVGSGTIETRIKMGNLMIDNMLAVLAGKPPLTPVNEPRGK